MREMPVRIVSDGVLTRSVRDTAAFYREAEKVWRNPLLAPIGDITRPGRARLRIAVVTQGIGRDSSPEVRELTLRDRRAAGGPRPPRRGDRQPGARQLPGALRAVLVAARPT